MQDLTLFNTDTAKVTTQDIQVFNCALGSIRVIIENGEPLFCLTDLAYSLDFRDGNNLKAQILAEYDNKPLYMFNMDRVVGTKKDGTPAIQNAPYSFITESQLYFVLMRSKSTKAKPFRQWVTNEVLPSIRKTGSYNVTQSQFKIPQTYAEALLEAGRLALENEKLIAQAKENEPKVKAFNELMQSKDALDFLTFSKIIGIGRTKLFAKLRELNILRADNTPYQRFIDNGYFRVIESSYTQNDTTRIYTKTMILPKGQKYITNKVKGA